MVALALRLAVARAARAGSVRMGQSPPWGSVQPAFRSARPATAGIMGTERVDPSAGFTGRSPGEWVALAGR